MNRDDIIRIAREAGINVEQGFLLRFAGVEDDLERFAALVAAAEREACAKVCERMARRTEDIRSAALEMASENIRAGGEK